MASLASKLPTFDELYRQIAALPQGVTGEILEPGALRTMSRPGSGHRRAARWLGEALRGFDSTLGGAGWWVEVEAEVRLLRDRLAVPDLSGWRVERVPVLPDENPLTIVPDWCCEILSPTTARDDRTLKLPLYARAGIAWIWLVDPDVHTVEVFETVNGRATLSATARESERISLPPFGSEFALGPWWLPGAESTPPER